MDVTLVDGAIWRPWSQGLTYLASHGYIWP